MPSLANAARSSRDAAPDLARGASAADPLGRHELPALTSIRGLLAWWVVVFHFAPSAPFHAAVHQVFIAKGIVAVDCFFVLSGFVLCHVHPVIIGRRPFGVADFLVSRLARIYPLHLAMLAAFVLVAASYRLTHPGALGPGAPFADDQMPGLLRQLALLHGWFRWGHDTAWNVPSWSISSEWAAYMLAPLAFLWLGHRRPGVAWLCAGLLTALVVCLGEFGLLFGGAMALPRVLLEFCLGASLRSGLRQGDAWLHRIRSPGLAAGWLAAFCLAWTAHAGLFLAAMIWLLLLLSLRTGRAQGMLGRIEQVAIYLGETSFAVYMCHAFILMLWNGVVTPRMHGILLHKVPDALLLAGVILGFACVLHHAVELPAQRAIRRRFRDWTLSRLVEPGPEALHGYR